MLFLLEGRGALLRRIGRIGARLRLAVEAQLPAVAGASERLPNHHRLDPWAPFREHRSEHDAYGTGERNEDRMLGLREKVLDTARPAWVPVPGMGQGDTAGKQSQRKLNQDAVDFHSFSHRVRDLVVFPSLPQHTEEEENTMIVVRNVFRLKFGQARAAVALWKEGHELMKRAGFKGESRILTDIVGPSYTLVFENKFESLAQFEQEAKTAMSNEEWRNWYQKFVPLAEAGTREIFTIVE